MKMGIKNELPHHNLVSQLIFAATASLRSLLQFFCFIEIYPLIIQIDFLFQ